MCCGTKTQVDFLKTTEKKKYSKETCLGNLKQKHRVEVMNKGQNWNTLWSDMKLRTKRSNNLFSPFYLPQCASLCVIYYLCLLFHFLSPLFSCLPLAGFVVFINVGELNQGNIKLYSSAGSIAILGLKKKNKTKKPRAIPNTSMLHCVFHSADIIESGVLKLFPGCV